MMLFPAIMVNDYEVEGSKGVVFFVSFCLFVLSLVKVNARKKNFPENKPDVGNLKETESF